MLRGKGLPRDELRSLTRECHSQRCSSQAVGIFWDAAHSVRGQAAGSHPVERQILPLQRPRRGQCARQVSRPQHGSACAHQSEPAIHLILVMTLLTTLNPKQAVWKLRGKKLQNPRPPSSLARLYLSLGRPLGHSVCLGFRVFPYWVEEDTIYEYFQRLFNFACRAVLGVEIV